MLRRGNRGSAKYWRRVLLPVIDTLPGPRHPQVLPRRFRVCRPEAAAAAGAGRLPLRHPPQDQRGAGAEDRPLAQASRGSAVAQAEGLLPQLPLSGRVVGVCPPRGGQGGVARGRVVPARRLHRHQPEVALEEGRPLLQPAGYGGAVDKRGQECGEVDEAVVPAFQGQRGAVAVVRPGVQPGQLPSAAGAAAVDPELEPDDACARSWSRSGPRWWRTPSTSSSSWRRWRCPASCSRRFWNGSAGCDWRVPRGEVHRAEQSGPKVVAGRSRCAARVDRGG